MRTPLLRAGSRLALCLMVTLLALCGDTLMPQEPDFTFDIDRSNTTATPSSDFILRGTVGAREGLDSLRVRVYDPMGHWLRNRMPFRCSVY
jgi:hypothetical protein